MSTFRRCQNPPSLPEKKRRRRRIHDRVFSQSKLWLLSCDKSTFKIDSHISPKGHIHGNIERQTSPLDRSPTEERKQRGRGKSRMRLKQCEIWRSELTRLLTDFTRFKRSKFDPSRTMLSIFLKIFLAAAHFCKCLGDFNSLPWWSIALWGTRASLNFRRSNRFEWMITDKSWSSSKFDVAVVSAAH